MDLIQTPLNRRLRMVIRLPGIRFEGGYPEKGGRLYYPRIFVPKYFFQLRQRLDANLPPYPGVDNASRLPEETDYEDIPFKVMTHSEATLNGRFDPEIVGSNDRVTGLPENPFHLICHHGGGTSCLN